MLNNMETQHALVFDFPRDLIEQYVFDCAEVGDAQMNPLHVYGDTKALKNMWIKIKNDRTVYDGLKKVLWENSGEKHYAKNAVKKTYFFKEFDKSEKSEHENNEAAEEDGLRGSATGGGLAAMSDKSSKDKILGEIEQQPKTETALHYEKEEKSFTCANFSRGEEEKAENFTQDENNIQKSENKIRADEDQMNCIAPRHHDSKEGKPDEEGCSNFLNEKCFAEVSDKNVPPQFDEEELLRHNEKKRFGVFEDHEKENLKFSANDATKETGEAKNEDPQGFESSVENRSTLQEKKREYGKISRKEKGQNKNRKVNFEYITKLKQNQLCYYFSQTGFCTNVGNCKFSHDADGYLQKKEKDISEECYVYNTYGVCPSGLNCRFGLKHISYTLKRNITFEGKVVQQSDILSFKQKEGKLNEFDLAKKKLLWSNKFSFDKAKKFFNKMKNVDDDQNSISLVSNFNIRDDNLKLKTAREGISLLYDSRKKKKIDFSENLILASLTTVGNLPFRKICVNYGADITMSEMIMADQILKGQSVELALLQRDKSEKCFGIQLAGGDPLTMTNCCELLCNEELDLKFDFFDFNIACPLENLHKRLAGSILMEKPNRVCEIIKGMKSVSSYPVSVKMRISHSNEKSVFSNSKKSKRSVLTHSAIQLCPILEECGVDAIFLHGRTSIQRYTKLADWNYIQQCALTLKDIPLIGCGDIMNIEEYNEKKQLYNVTNALIARGALIKPWIFYEIKNNTHLDFSASQRVDMMRSFVESGLTHWGADSKGVATTRRFLLEWLSFLYRYIPLGLILRGYQKLNSRPPNFFGRNDIETKLASSRVQDWIEISEMFLGPAPNDFVFKPKHKSSAY